MRISVLTFAWNSWGADMLHSLAGDYLSQGLSEYPEVREIGVDIYFRPAKPPGGNRGDFYAEFERRLARLPRRRFYRKKSRLEIEYESRRVVSDPETELRRLSTVGFRTALVEVRDQLRASRPRLERIAGFDVQRFLSELDARVEGAPTGDSAFGVLADAFEKKTEAREAAMFSLLSGEAVPGVSWEEALGVQWDEWHPMARRILDDPLFWNPLDDFGPHGNDTGGDLIGEFREWNRRNPQRPAWELLAEWFPEGDVRLEEDESLHVDEAYIAAAFASLKVRGTCDPITRDRALEAIARQRAVAEGACGSWIHADRRQGTLEKMRRVLEQRDE